PQTLRGALPGPVGRLGRTAALRGRPPSHLALLHSHRGPASAAAPILPEPSVYPTYGAALSGLSAANDVRVFSPTEPCTRATYRPIPPHQPISCHSLRSSKVSAAIEGRPETAGFLFGDTNVTFAVLGAFPLTGCRPPGAARTLSGISAGRSRYGRSTRKRMPGSGPGACFHPVHRREGRGGTAGGTGSRAGISQSLPSRTAPSSHEDRPHWRHTTLWWMYDHQEGNHHSRRIPGRGAVRRRRRRSHPTLQAHRRRRRARSAAASRPGRSKGVGGRTGCLHPGGARRGPRRDGGRRRG